MKWLNFIKKKKENPFFTKLKGLIPLSIKLKDIKSIFYVGGIAYSESDYEKVKTAILENELDSFLKRVVYDVHHDNIELYLVEDKADNQVILLLFDPVELYQKEQILEIIPINGRN
jgi:hypothetical protein